jgi:uncharacterized protein (DUF2384 family)
MSPDDDRFDEAPSAPIKLSEAGQRRFAAMAECPPKPTEAMKSLQALHGFDVRVSEADVGISPEDFNTLLAVVTAMVVSPPGDWVPREWLARWMTNPVPALASLSPAEVLKRPGGLEQVVKVLKCMESGAYL